MKPKKKGPTRKKFGFGGDGLVQWRLVLSMLMMEHSLLRPNINRENPDEDPQLNLVKKNTDKNEIFVESLDEVRFSHAKKKVKIKNE